MRRPSAVAKTNLDNLFIFAPPIVVILRVPMLENRVSVKRLMSLHRIGKRLTNIAETHPPWQKAGQRSTRNDQWNHEHDEAVPPSVGPARVMEERLRRAHGSIDRFSCCVVQPFAMGDAFRRYLSIFCRFCAKTLTVSLIPCSPASV